MIITLKPNISEEARHQVALLLEEKGYQLREQGSGQTRIIALPSVERLQNPGAESSASILETIVRLEGVQEAKGFQTPFPLASREVQPDNSLMPFGSSVVGGQALQIIAGPCSVESRSQILEIAHAVKEVGATALRGGAYKPRTSPYSFQGYGEKALQWLAEAREQTGLPIVTEVMSPEYLQQVSEYADILQVGSRNMQNFMLLKAVAQSDKPVLLKRGMNNQVKEWLLAAEYILSHGNPHVILCERGIRTFATHTRNTFDVNAIPAVKAVSHLPVLADPSHGTGKWEYVTPIAKSAIAAGADGLMLEVHHQPEKALSDGPQSLKPKRFQELIEQVKRIAHAVDRTLEHTPTDEQTEKHSTFPRRK